MLFYGSGQNHKNSGMGMVELGTIFLLLIFKEMLLMFHPYAIRLGFEQITLIIVKAFSSISYLEFSKSFFFSLIVNMCRILSNVLCAHTEMLSEVFLC